MVGYTSWFGLFLGDSTFRLNFGLGLGLYFCMYVCMYVCMYGLPSFPFLSLPSSFLPFLLPSYPSFHPFPPSLLSFPFPPFPSPITYAVLVGERGSSSSCSYASMLHARNVPFSSVEDLGWD